jgi:hypothetical protein
VRRSKYNAIRTKVDGITFDSKLEAKRWGELKLLQSAGVIRNLMHHQRYSLEALGGATIGKYEVDFVYEEKIPKGAAWLKVFEDCKGIITPLAKWKIKHFEGQYFEIVRIIKR